MKTSNKEIMLENKYIKIVILNCKRYINLTKEGILTMENNKNFERGVEARKDGRNGNGYDQYDNTFKNTSKAFETLNVLSPDLSDQEHVDESLKWLILSAWSNLDRMKKLQEEIAITLEEAKKIARL
jgi:hypothetical protein